MAAVAAVDEGTAEEALDLITVEYKELPGLFDPVEAAKPGAPLIHENLETYVRASTVNPIKGTNVWNHFQLRKRDVEKGFKESDYIFDDTFTTQVRHPSVAHIKTGFKRDGTILARDVKIYYATGAVFEISGKVEKSLITSIRNRLHRHEMH